MKGTLGPRQPSLRTLNERPVLSAQARPFSFWPLPPLMVDLISTSLTTSPLSRYLELYICNSGAYLPRSALALVCSRP